MTDKKVDLTQLMVAGPMQEGSIDDHVEVAPKYNIGREADPNIKYYVFHFADFHVDVIPIVHYTYPAGVSMLEDGSDYHIAASHSNREWKKKIIVAEDLDQETAIRKAKEYGLANTLPVYVKNNKTWTTEVIQKPEGWEPHFG